MKIASGNYDFVGVGNKELDSVNMLDYADGNKDVIDIVLNSEEL